MPLEVMLLTAITAQLPYVLSSMSYLNKGCRLGERVIIPPKTTSQFAQTRSKKANYSSSKVSGVLSNLD
ncbi:hypothetical protein HOLleu_38786 [Holothuria leucospilota]|uniref:Uncharacterized protein n=1 Tax=Holothuria leucospilota TaxID=206669 RepID=A0A9Q1BCI1_HOLLE|nr:hypothetical protein HOLleu_38786 [Holothuria leucospilota]